MRHRIVLFTCDRYKRTLDPSPRLITCQAAGSRGSRTARPKRSRYTSTGDAPPSVQTFMQASGGGETSATAIDEDNDYSNVSNGGEFMEPTYRSP